MYQTTLDNRKVCCICKKPIDEHPMKVTNNGKLDFCHSLCWHNCH